MLPALLLLIAILAAGCGGERTFEPAEFVDDANAAGAGLILGDELASAQEGVDVYEVSLEEHPGEEPEHEPGGHEHSGGSLVLTEDADAAAGEFQRCEAAASLTCYRAANVVLYFDGEPIAEIDAALRDLASE